MQDKDMKTTWPCFTKNVKLEENRGHEVCFKINETKAQHQRRGRGSKYRRLKRDHFSIGVSKARADRMSVEELILDSEKKGRREIWAQMKTLLKNQWQKLRMFTYPSSVEEKGLRVGNESKVRKAGTTWHREQERELNTGTQKVYRSAQGWRS